MKLTKARIEKFEYDGDGRSADIRRDDEITGFGVRIYPSGRNRYPLQGCNEGLESARKHKSLIPEYFSQMTEIGQYSCRSPDIENPANAGFVFGGYRPTHVMHQLTRERQVKRGYLIPSSFCCPATKLSG